MSDLRAFASNVRGHLVRFVARSKRAAQESVKQFESLSDEQLERIAAEDARLDSVARLNHRAVAREVI